MAVDAVGAAGVFSAPAVQVGVIEFEVVLGLWLLSGKHRIGSWLAAFAAFTSFAGASFYLGWIGQTSCGCFGSLSVKPWSALGIDVLTLAALLIARPDLRALRKNPQSTLIRPLAFAGIGLLGVSSLLGLLAGVAHWKFGSTAAALAHLRGESISLYPRLVDVGDGTPGEIRESVVELVNRTDETVRVVGGTSDCSCVATDNLPASIAPGESRFLTVKIKMPHDPGMFTRSATLFTGDEPIRLIGFRLTGRTVSPPEGAESANGK